jgi:hypothetical protein
MSKLTLLLAVSAFTVGGLTITGCGNGQDRSAKTSESAAMISVDVTEAKKILDQVVTGLKNLRDASDSADLKKLYNEVEAPRDDLQDALADVAASSEAAVAAGKAQNDQWHKDADTFSDAGLRSASNKRQADLRLAVDELATSTSTLKGVSDPYVAQVQQTLKAVDLDLSQQGVAVIKPIVGKLVDDEAKLRSALNDVDAKGKALNTVLNP